jgi:hypothetical protein
VLCRIYNIQIYDIFFFFVLSSWRVAVAKRAQTKLNSPRTNTHKQTRSFLWDRTQEQQKNPQNRPRLVEILLAKYLARQIFV